MAQHFLLSAAARSLSAAKIMRMSDRGVENVFLRLRWPETDGKPVCPGCGCTICYACRAIGGPIRDGAARRAAVISRSPRAPCSPGTSCRSGPICLPSPASATR